MTFHRALLPILSLVCSAVASVDVAGTVTDATSDVPLPKVRIFGPDSSFIDASDAQGRFLLKLPRPQEIVFRKDGYRDRVVTLRDIANLTDMQVDMDPMGTRLETGEVTGRGGRRRATVGTIASIEDVSGMRFDLQEHLRTLPGVGGTREFSSEISVYGSRTADVQNVLGPFPIPNLRHLDYSFPGNQSVLNPRVLQSITVEHDPTNGPLEQGLASALRYQPRRASSDKYEATGSLGLTNRELDLMGPVGNGGVVLSARWLDPSLMNHLGDRFFAGSHGQDPSDPNGSSAPVSKLDIQALDAYLRIEQGFGNFAFATTALGSFDQYTVKLKTSPYDQNGALRADTYVPITQGDRTDWVAFSDLQGDIDAGFLQTYVGVIGRTESQLLSDTVLFAESHDLAPGQTQFSPEDWAAWTKSVRDYRGGGLFRLGTPVLGAEAEVLAAFDQVSEGLAQGRYFKGAVGYQIDDDRRLSQLNGTTTPSAILANNTWLRGRGSARLRWVDGESHYGVAAGGLWAEGPGWNSEFTASAMHPEWGIGWVGNASMRAMEYSRATAPGVLSVVATTGSEIKLGAGKKLGPLELTGTIYGRDLQNPQLPVPDFWWAFPLSEQADGAQVFGGNFQTRFDTWRRMKALVNLSRVEGEYQMKDGSVREWDANRDLDVLTEFKIFPLEDTLFSFIVTHVASFGKPQYIYLLDTLNHTVSILGDPRLAGDDPKRNAFRTDVRLELDMPAKVPPIQGVRLYLEVQNLFSGFDGDWAKYLGGSNLRARSMEAMKVRGTFLQYGVPKEGGYRVYGAEPLYARGTDLFFTFGVEGSLGI